MTWLMALAGIVLLAVTFGMYRRFWRRADAPWGGCRECRTDDRRAATPQERQARREASRDASRVAARDYVRRLQSTQAQTPACEHKEE